MNACDQVSFPNSVASDSSWESAIPEAHISFLTENDEKVRPRSSF